MRAVSKRLKTESEVALKDEAMQGALPQFVLFTYATDVDAGWRTDD